MRAGGPGADVAIEIDVERAVELQAIPVHVDHVDLVVAFRRSRCRPAPGLRRESSRSPPDVARRS